MKASIFVFFSFLAVNPKNLRISHSRKEKHLHISFCYYHLKYNVYTAYVILLIDQSLLIFRVPTVQIRAVSSWFPGGIFLQLYNVY